MFEHWSEILQPSRLDRNWSLVTALDELERCWVVVAGARCVHQSAFRVAGEDGALDDYAFTCADHVGLVVESGYVVTGLADGPVR
jgi:hypothetical protein